MHKLICSPTKRIAAHCAALLLCATSLPGCGGGGSSDGDGRTAATTSAATLPLPSATQSATQEAAKTAVTAAPAVVVPTTIVVRALGVLAGNQGPIIELRIDGVVSGRQEVRSTQLADYTFAAPDLHAGSKVDVVYVNDDVVNGQDRNLVVAYLQAGTVTVLPNAPGVTYDRGYGSDAFDGIDVLEGRNDLAMSGALRFTWPATDDTDPLLARRVAASRFLQQASFGPTLAEIDRVATSGASAWVDEQMAMPHVPDFVNFVQSKYALGDDYRPGGAKYDQGWVPQRFWATASKGQDQLRKRVGFALHHMLMVSQFDGNLQLQARAYADYLDTLNKHAFGNYRTLLEDIALSPAMGLYLSHMRNRKEDASAGRLPDENFARELMQLFSIGLVELNLDGTPKLDANGKPIETYSNADVMAMAKVFTGYSWGFPDNKLTDTTFLSVSPDSRIATDDKIDLKRMRAYPGMYSTAEKRLFAGKPQQVVIPAGSSAETGLRMALDALFQHPNVGPFVSRQLINQLVTSNPSAAFVARVSAVFNDNGSGVRGDLGAVVRAILLAQSNSKVAPQPEMGKLREPMLRTAQWMRAFDAKSASGDFVMVLELAGSGQTPMAPNSVFGYFRPGYVPPNTQLSEGGITAPEFQIVNEATTIEWINLAQAMSGWGLGWSGNGPDVASTYATLTQQSAKGNLGAMIDQVSLLLLSGTMSASLRQELMDTAASISGNTAADHLNRARAVVFLTLVSPEYLVQR